VVTFGVACRDAVLGGDAETAVHETTLAAMRRNYFSGVRTRLCRYPGPDQEQRQLGAGKENVAVAPGWLDQWSSPQKHWAAQAVAEFQELRTATTAVQRRRRKR
jgi:hypothetical protein